jgi:hypothetical protein
MIKIDFMTMRIRRLHKVSFLCLLILCLLTSPASSFGYVWCVSDAGHATLETAMDDVCSLDLPTHPVGDFPVLALNADANDCDPYPCDPCYDISNSLRWGPASDHDTETAISIPAAHASVIVATPLSLSDQYLTGHLKADPTPRIPESIRYHRTIILLI